jgi:hypothetical protein
LAINAATSKKSDATPGTTFLLSAISRPSAVMDLVREERLLLTEAKDRRQIVFAERRPSRD